MFPARFLFENNQAVKNKNRMETKIVTQVECKIYFYYRFWRAVWQTENQQKGIVKNVLINAFVKHGR